MPGSPLAGVLVCGGGKTVRLARLRGCRPYLRGKQCELCVLPLPNLTHSMDLAAALLAHSYIQRRSTRKLVRGSFGCSCSGSSVGHALAIQLKRRGPNTSTGLFPTSEILVHHSPNDARSETPRTCRQCEKGTPLRSPAPPSTPCTG